MEKFRDKKLKIKSLLKEIYEKESAGKLDLILSQLMQILKENAPSKKEEKARYHLWGESSVVLITYPDAIYYAEKPSLEILSELITNYLGNLSPIVHILPFLKSTSDGGFAVSSHEEIDPSFGDWNNLKKIAEDRDVMADLVLNHVSSSHPWVKDFRKDKEPCSKFILSPAKDQDWSKVFRPRDSSLFISIQTICGPKNVWATFGADQIDVNWNEPELLVEYLKVIARYIKNGVSWLRLDAVGFIWKKPGNKCLHEKEAHKLVELIRYLFNSILKKGVLITETNVPEKDNLSYLMNGTEANVAYNFPLPPLTLEAIITNKADLLNTWLKSWPELNKQTTLLNFTACHDGIGLIPLKGLMNKERFENLLVECEARGGLVSHRNIGKGMEEPYELNISWWSAMKDRNDRKGSSQIKRFILSQLFVMALPGIPALYLQAILASENDIKTFKKTGQRRDLNRERFDAYSLFENLNSPDSIQSKNIRSLQSAVKIRSTLQAFHPNSSMKIVSILKQSLVCFSRGEGDDIVWAIHNFTDQSYMFSLIDLKINLNSQINYQWKDCLSGSSITKSTIKINSYEVLWLKKSRVRNDYGK